MPIDNLPPLSEVIAKYDLMAKKNLGQNFLLDLNLTSKIASLAGPLENSRVLEIGPGPGGLTRALLAQGALVTAVERDERCLPALEEISRAYPGKLRIIMGDALETNFHALFPDHQRDIKIVANLPYNIATQLLINWLTDKTWPSFFSSLTLMFQKEVAERITAKASSPHYGRLSVISNWRCQTKIAFDISPRAFTPPPKITSSVVRLIPLEAPLACALEKLETVSKTAFNQRRKMLRQSLKALGGSDLLQKAGIEETRRAETLAIHEFVALANAL